MFRKMRRFKQQISDEQSKELLKKTKRGILSLAGDEGYPYGIPINFYYDEEDHAIYFHSAKEGHKIDAIARNDKVCFTVMNNDRIDEKDGRTIWKVLWYSDVHPLWKMKKSSGVGQENLPESIFLPMNM